MAKYIITLMMFVAFTLALMVTMAHDINISPKGVEEWFNNVIVKQADPNQKITKLHFYFHDLFEFGQLGQGVQPTSYRVAQADITQKSPSYFGSTLVADNPLTLEPKLDSKIIGRAQGMYSSSSMKEFSMVMNMNFIFTEGPHNGSSFCLVGWNPTTHTYREMSVVGGSGVFRMARGVATGKTIYFVHNILILELSVMILHY